MISRKKTHPSAEVFDVALLYLAGASCCKVRNVDHSEVTTCLIVKDIGGLAISMMKLVLVVDIGQKASQGLKVLHQLWDTPAFALSVDDIC